MFQSDATKNAINAQGTRQRLCSCLPALTMLAEHFDGCVDVAAKKRSVDSFERTQRFGGELLPFSVQLQKLDALSKT